MAAERGLPTVTFIHTYAPIGVLWVIGSFVLFRGLQRAAANDWGASIRTYIIGLSLLAVASVLTARCRRSAEVDLVKQDVALTAEKTATLEEKVADLQKQIADLREQAAQIQAAADKQWQLDSENAVTALHKAFTDARCRERMAAMHIVRRDEASSP